MKCLIGGSNQGINPKMKIGNVVEATRNLVHRRLSGRFLDILATAIKLV